MTTDDLLVSPDLYLAITAEHYMREHLFDSPALLAHVCSHFHPDVAPEHVEQWRAQYSSVARSGDRTGMTVHRAEREAVTGILDDAAARGLDNRDTIRLVCRSTFRVMPSVGAAESLATRVTKGHTKVAWSAEEDAQLLNGREVRGDSVDVSRRSRLRKLLGYRGSATVPVPVAAEPAAAEPDAAPATFPAPAAPMLTINVCDGISVSVDQTATAVTITAGHDSILLAGVEAKSLQSALAMVARLTGANE